MFIRGKNHTTSYPKPPSDGNQLGKKKLSQMRGFSDLLLSENTIPILNLKSNLGQSRSQVNFGIWPRNGFFTLKLTLQPQKSVLEVKKPTFGNFLWASPEAVKS